MKMKKIIVSSFVFLALAACKKVEGQGGKGTISGKIMINQWSYIDNVPNLEGSYAGAGEDVYIIYGTDDEIFDDKIECNFDGTFKIPNLRPGKYTLFGYNKVFHPGASITNNDDDYYTLEAVKTTVDLSKKEAKDIGTITLKK